MTSNVISITPGYSGIRRLGSLNPSLGAWGRRSVGQIVFRGLKGVSQLTDPLTDPFAGKGVAPYPQGWNPELSSLTLWAS